MSTFRVKKDKENPYVMLNKSFLKDSSISWKAKGLLAYLLSLPDDWQVYENELVTHATDGKDSLKSTINELIKAGYIEKGKRLREKGKLKGYEYSVHEVSNQNGKSYVGNSYIGKPATTNNDIKLNNNIKLSNKYLQFSEKTVFELFSNGVAEYLNSYLQLHKCYLCKNHVRLNQNRIEYVQATIDDVINNNIDLEEWIGAVEEYFQKLGPNNNGSILSFLKSLPRFFDELRVG